MRRLFHNDGETTPIAQPTNTQPFSEGGVSILNCTDCENIMDSSSQLSTDLFVSPKKCDHDNTISDVCVTPPTCESGSTSSFVNSTLSLDVLFMSNSQLDALEERRNNDHTPDHTLLQVSAETEMCTNSVVDDHVHNESKETKGDHTYSETTNDHILCQSKEINDDCTRIQLEIQNQSFIEIDNHTLCQPINDPSQSKEMISDSTHNKSMNDHTHNQSISDHIYNQSISDHTYNQSIIKDTEIKTSRSKKFIYPKSVKVSSLPVKRPPSYELPHLKKRPNLSLPRQPMSAMTTPIQRKRTNEMTAGENGRPSSYESTPFGRPNKSLKFNLKDNKIIDRSTECDIKNSRDCVSEFHPELTSTPSIVKADNKFTVGFRTLSGKDVVPSSAAIERAKCMIENIERDIVEHLNERCMSTDEEILPLKNERPLNDEQNKKVIDKDLAIPSSDSINVEEEMTDTQYIQGLLPAGIDWEEFSTFTQIPTKEENPSLLTNKDIPADVSDTPTKCLTDTTPTIPPIFGFTTASGHNVQISETAIESAKKLLFTQDDQNNVDTPDLQTTPTCVGFATAAGRKIEISKESLDRANKLLAKPTDTPIDTPIDNYMDIDKQPIKGNLSFTNASGKAIPEEPLDKVRSLLDTPPNNEENVTPPKDFASECDESLTSIAPALGFRTAAGNVVSVSEDSLCKAKSLLSDEVPTTSTTALGFSTASGRDVTVSEKSLQAVKSLFDDQSNTAVTSVFSTASGRDVTVSEKSLQAVKSLFDDQSNTAVTSVFSTASGRDVTVSEKSLQAVKSLFDDQSNTAVTSVFSTASGRDVTVSEKSLQAVKSLFDDQSNTAVTSVFSTASGRDVTVSEKSLQAVKSLFDDQSNTAVASVFSTASGRDVTVSEKSLQAVKSLFDDQSNTAVTSVFSTASGRDVTVSEKSLQAVKSLFDDQSNTAVTSVFSTASGRDVTVSEKSLQAVKSLFDDQSNTAVTSVFSTASGRDVTVSEKSLQAVKSLFDDQSNTAVTSVFSTASGRDVTVSEKSLQAVKSLFDDQSNTAVTSVFSTASGRDVTVSEKSLQAVKSLFDDQSNTAVTSVFSTASGRDVTVSEKSLQAIKSLFDDCETTPIQQTTPSSGLETSQLKTTLDGIESSSNEAPPITTPTKGD